MEGQVSPYKRISKLAQIKSISKSHPIASAMYPTTFILSAPILTKITLKTLKYVLL